MKPTQIRFGSKAFFEMASNNMVTLENNERVPRRPDCNRRGFARLYAAWLVFVGRADALMWLEDHYQSAPRS